MAMNVNYFRNTQVQGGRISQVSNELEFNIHGLSAQKIIKHNGLPLVAEVNPHSMLELNVSLADNADDLNSNVEELVGKLVATTNKLGGSIYGGSSLLENVEGVEPARYRTTSLSESCARGFLDIASMQIVIGVRGEEYGLKLFNYLHNINPLMLGLSGSSPFRLEGEDLVDTGYESRRIGSYRDICRYFPESMLEISHLDSMQQYEDALQDISDEVICAFQSGVLDANVEELTRPREGGAYFPFETLEPHQIYWMNRVRPDHANEQSDFSIEMRVSDIPTTVDDMQAINSFVLGLCYYTEQNGFDLPVINGTGFDNLEIAAKGGLDGRLDGKRIGSHIKTLMPYSIEGLRIRGCESYPMTERINRIMGDGTSAQNIRLNNNEDAVEMRNYLAQMLATGR